MNDFPKVSEGILGEQDAAKTNTELFLSLVGQYFPEAIKDGEVDFTALKEEMGQFAEVGSEHYDFTWAGKQAAKKEALADIFGKTLRYKPQDSVDPDNTENLYIEGDNLEALKLLRRNYHGKIKMIYIVIWTPSIIRVSINRFISYHFIMIARSDYIISNTGCQG